MNTPYGPAGYYPPTYCPPDLIGLPPSGRAAPYMPPTYCPPSYLPVWLVGGSTGGATPVQPYITPSPAGWKSTATRVGPDPRFSRGSRVGIGPGG